MEEFSGKLEKGAFEGRLQEAFGELPPEQFVRVHKVWCRAINKGDRQTGALSCGGGRIWRSVLEIWIAWLVVPLVAASLQFNAAAKIIGCIIDHAARSR